MEGHSHCMREALRERVWHKVGSGVVWCGVVSCGVVWGAMAWFRMVGYSIYICMV